MPFAKTLRLSILLLVSGLIVCPGGPCAAPSDDPFPIPDLIQPNVDFWTKVYSSFSTRQGIVHDNVDLNLIYDIIDLRAYDDPDANKINRDRIKRATQKYREILLELAGNPHAAGQEHQRVASLFSKHGDVRRYESAAERIRCQIGQKDRFMTGLVRSGAYLEQIRDIFKSQGLPEDLCYLPHVESSFNHQAYSKFGAAGMWQFTRSTGSRFMDVGYAVDERRDPVLATYAAALLLKENHEKLGSWPLAITAYNHGCAGMERAKQVHGDDYGAIFTHYRSQSFKFASRNFYPEFLAARQVASNYRTYFGELALDRPEPIHIVVLEGFLAFRDASRHYRIDPLRLQKLNPALREPVLEGQKHIPKGYALRLPNSESDSEPPLLASIPMDLYHGSQKPSHFYTVQPNDTAGRIARRHGIDLNDLILANNLDRRATIFPRQTLRIPLPGEPVAPPSQVAANTSAPLLGTSLDQQTSLPEITPDDGAGNYPQPVLASVIPLPSKSQDSIAAPHDQSEISSRTDLNSEVVMAVVGFNQIFENNNRRMGTIQVEIEETLGHYAEWADVRTHQIRNLNELSFDSVLQLNQKINIPLSRVTAQTFEQNRYEYHKKLQEDFFSVYRVSEVHPYQVTAGDTYWRLCRQTFEIPHWLLKHYNHGVDLGNLRAGQKLVIPEIEKADPEDAATPPMEEEM